MYQSGRAGDEAKKRESPAKSGRVGIYDYGTSKLKAVLVFVSLLVSRVSSLDSGLVWPKSM